jgi:hypothetical protein
MNKQLVKLCDELLADWFNSDDEKSKRAWGKLLKDIKNK